MQKLSKITLKKIVPFPYIILSDSRHRVHFWKIRGNSTRIDGPNQGADPSRTNPCWKKASPKKANAYWITA